MFGRSLAQYVSFEKPILILIAVVWLLRMGLSTAGMPTAGVRFFSITGVLALGSLYYGWAASRQGFGSFKQLYGANLIQGLVSQTLIAAAIVLAIVTGQDNIYTIPEFYPASAGGDPLGLPPDGKNLGHAIAHIVVVGALVGPIVGWLLSSAVHLATRKKA
jgi:hypothetical protein